MSPVVDLTREISFTNQKNAGAQCIKEESDETDNEDGERKLQFTSPRIIRTHQVKSFDHSSGRNKIFSSQGGGGHTVLGIYSPIKRGAKSS